MTYVNGNKDEIGLRVKALPKRFQSACARFGGKNGVHSVVIAMTNIAPPFFCSFNKVG